MFQSVGIPATLYNMSGFKSAATSFEGEKKKSAKDVLNIKVPATGTYF